MSVLSGNHTTQVCLVLFPALLCRVDSWDRERECFLAVTWVVLYHFNGRTVLSARSLLDPRFDRLDLLDLEVDALFFFFGLADADRPLRPLGAFDLRPFGVSDLRFGESLPSRSRTDLDRLAFL